MRTFADSALAYTAKRAQQLLVEFRFLVDWPPYLPNLNLLDCGTRHVLQAKAQATPHSNLTPLRPSIAAEQERKAAVYFRQTSFFASKRANAYIF